MESRLWTFDDIKDATARHETYRNTDSPARHYYYGMALEMAGQPEEADDKYVVFRAEAERTFGDLEQGAAHYETEAEAFVGDERQILHHMQMARILRGPKPGSERHIIRKCAVW